MSKRSVTSKSKFIAEKQQKSTRKNTFPVKDRAQTYSKQIKPNRTQNKTEKSGNLISEPLSIKVTDEGSKKFRSFEDKLSISNDMPTPENFYKASCRLVDRSVNMLPRPPRYEIKL